MAAGNKTKATGVSVATFLEQVEPEQRRADAQRVIDLMARISGETATMWGPSIIGFGVHRYRYESGREGEVCRLGFSPRKGKTVLYVKTAFPHYAKILKQLGKHKTDGGCLYIKRLSDLNMDALEQLCAASLAYTAEKYPAGD